MFTQYIYLNEISEFSGCLQDICCNITEPFDHIIYIIFIEMYDYWKRTCICDVVFDSIKKKVLKIETLFFLSGFASYKAVG